MGVVLALAFGCRRAIPARRKVFGQRRSLAVGCPSFQSQLLLLLAEAEGNDSRGGGNKVKGTLQNVEEED
jgi:hypothetical protein